MATSYRDYQTEARDLVESLIASSLQQLERESFSKSINWLTVGQWTPDSCQSSIEQFIESWKLDSSWLHHTSYMGLNSETNLHGYRVIFSQPSRRKPVPRATATVFFYVAIRSCDTSHDEQEPVKIFYVVEGQRVVLRPGFGDFREVWLKNVITNKLTVTGRIHL